MRHHILPPLVGLVLFCSATTVLADDSSIAQDLGSRLRQAKTEGGLSDFRIGVKVEDGVVWLSGNVSDDRQRERALDIARRVAGVRLVVNDLKCATDQGVPADPILPAPSHGTEPRTDVVAAPEGLEEPADVPAGHVASPTPQPRQPILFPQPHIQETSATAFARPLPPGALLVVPNYSAVPAFPVPPVAQSAADHPGHQSKMKTAPVRAAPKPVPLARSKPAQLVNYQHMAGPPIPKGSCQDGFCHYGSAPDGMIHHHGMSHGGNGSYGHGMSVDGGYYGGSYGVPVPEHGAGGMSGVMYDNPQMPGHAWPSYAAYPNYGAVTYPRQYSPMAWPYIGPFYPYPQVPLGWRKVSLEWDDGWWMLDFKSK